MQNHAGQLRLGFDLWPFNLRVCACPGPAMDYMSIDFADSSSRFHFRLKHEQTEKRTSSKMKPRCHETMLEHLTEDALSTMARDV